MFHLPKQFELAACLEVAEHIPETSASHLIDELTGCAPVVLFSAAIPGQGGTQHVNEQWPEYWRELFGRRGYRPVDAIRGRIIQDPSVEWWYRQNILVYCDPAHVPPGMATVSDPRVLNYIDPQMIEAMAQGVPGIKGAAHAVMRDMGALGRALASSLRGHHA